MVLSAALAATAGAYNVTYHGHRVERLVVHRDALAALDATLDVWGMKPLNATHALCDVMGTAEQLRRIPGGDAELLIPDVQAQIDEEERRLRGKGQGGAPNGFYDDFQTVDETNKYLDQIVAEHGDLVSRFQISASSDAKEPIWAYRVTTQPDAKKFGLYVQSQVHAREWLAGPTCVYLLQQLVLDWKANDPDARAILNALEFTFVPLMNPDGIRWSWSNDRMWRKNRRVNAGTSARGVDLNRNWGPAATWCSSGSSRDPASDTYCGTAPFSEQEISGARQYLDQNAATYQSAVDLHTYALLLLYPWQYTSGRIPEPDRSAFAALGTSMAQAMRNSGGQNWQPQPGSDLYPHSGGLIDYNYEINKMWTFTIEGRGTSFVVPPAQILPACQENYAGFKVLAKYVIENGKPKGPSSA